jgi:MscS family membrane protein
MTIAQTPATHTLTETVVKDANVVVGALGWIALAVIVGWASKRALGWLAEKFTNSPIAEAAIAAVGRALQVLVPVYAVWLIQENNPTLIPTDYDATAKIVITLLLSVAHTASVYHLVAVPMAWAQKIADETENKLDDVLVPMLRTVIKIAVVLIGAVKAVSIVDPETSKSFLALLATGGLAIGLASQDTIKNIFGAVMLIVDQPFTLGDLINTGSHEGRVRALGLRSTTIELVDGQVLTIPNSDLANRPIVNITRRDFIRAQDLVHLEVNTPAEKLQQALEIVRRLLADHEGSDASHPPLVHVLELSDWAINIRFIYWYHPAVGAKQLEFNQKLLLRIAAEFQQAGIRLAAAGTPQNR